jgi:hypothetical protein
MIKSVKKGETLYFYQSSQIQDKNGTPPIYFGEPRAEPKWEIEKSVLLFYDDEE